MRARHCSQGAELSPAPSVNLVEAYIDLIGSAETDHSKEIQRLPRGDMRRACMAIGRACWLYRHNTPAATRMLRRARADLSPTPPPRIVTDKAPQFRSVIDLILAKDDPEELESVQKRFYRQTLTLLGHLRSRERRAEQGQITLDPGEWRGIIGDRVESRAQCMVNRPAGAVRAGVIALPALIHHDRHFERGVNHNFDLAVIGYPFGSTLDVETDIETAQGGGAILTAKPSLRKAQLKSACFGLCDRPADAETQEGRRQEFEELRSRYDPDITLLSGCCDFRTGTVNGVSNDVDRLLIREFDGIATRSEVVALNGVTDRVLDILADSEAVGRSGLYGVKPEPAPPASPRIPDWVYGKFD